MRDLRRGEEGRQRHVHGATGTDREIQRQPVRPIVESTGDAIRTERVERGVERADPRDQRIAGPCGIASGHPCRGACEGRDEIGEPVHGTPIAHDIAGQPDVDGASSSRPCR